MSASPKAAISLLFPSVTMWLLLAPSASASTWPPDVLLTFEGSDPFSWADGDADGIDDPWLGVLQTWPSSRPAAEPELWSLPGACAYSEFDVERSSGPGEPIRIAVTGARDGEAWAEEFALWPGAATPELQWQAPVGDGASAPRYVGDVDGDGISDLFVFTEYTFDAMKGAVHLSSTGVLQPLPVPVRTWDVDPVHRVGDLDGDGFVELAVLSPVDTKPGSVWGALVHSLLVLRGGPDGFDPFPLWEIEYRQRLGGEDWDSPGVGVVRLENAAGEVRLAVSWTHHSRYESAVSFRSVDLLGQVGTSAPVVLQTVSPSGWYIDGYWDLYMVRMDAAAGASLVVATDGMAAWFAWDPVADLLSPSPTASDGWVDGWGNFGADPGPFGALYDADYPTRFGLWGWSPPGGIVPISLASDDPRLVDCLPPISTSSTTSSSHDSGGPLGTEPTDPPAGGRSAACSCATEGTSAAPIYGWLLAAAGALAGVRAARRARA